jgi:superfamily II DNA/RNA helicase
MAHYNNKNRSQSSSSKNYSGKPGNRPSGPRRSSFKEIKKFDPSLFMKTVEEQVVSAVYTPKHTFADFLLEQQIKDNIAAKGYINPTPIQDDAIPILLQGRDIIATANTGTGKTAAFLIPLVNNIVTKKTTRALVITPTRELAVQIDKELFLFKNKTALKSAVCIGGLPMHKQSSQLSKNPEFIIGTPGRLIDLEQNRLINFNNFDAIVLDEVDTMLDMGFINDIKYIISKLPAKRHSLFFSATMPKNIKKVMDGFLHSPAMISVKTRQSAENVNQDIVKIGQQVKIELLHDLLIKPEVTKSIIFLRTKYIADRLSRDLTSRGFKIATIHGDKAQNQRTKALLSFKENKTNILLATDVVARGIDIDDVSHVINYDLPQTHEDYIHRIGRTGRAGKIGQAITFVE